MFCTVDLCPIMLPVYCDIAAKVLHSNIEIRAIRVQRSMRLLTVVVRFAIKGIAHNLWGDYIKSHSHVCVCEEKVGKEI